MSAEQVTDRSEYEVHQIQPGVWGRKIPPEEMVLKPEVVEKFIKEVANGSEASEKFLRKIYFPEQPFVARLLKGISKRFSR